MTSLVPSPKRILLVEHDAELQDILRTLLSDEGYAVISASSLGEALTLLGEQSFHMVLTDLFRGLGFDAFEEVEPLRQMADPTPVALMTAWDLTEEMVKQRGFSCLIPKPFDIDRLLGMVAICLAAPFTPEQERHIPIIKRFLIAQEQKDIETSLALCVDDIRYYPPTRRPAYAPYAEREAVSGKTALRATLEQTFRAYPDGTLGELLFYPLPKGISVRYLWRWTSPEGKQRHFTGGLLFYFAGGLLSQISISIHSPETLSPPLQTDRPDLSSSYNSAF